MPNIIHMFLDPTRLHLLHSDVLILFISKNKYNMPIVNYELGGVSAK